MLVCLVRKLADCIDGVDVAPYGIGDEIDLPERQARLLLAEGWVVVDRRSQTLPLPGRERRLRRKWSTAREPLATAADTPRQRAAQDDKPPNVQYDDCEERESRVAATIDHHRGERRRAARKQRRNRRTP
jgi:hypothetical protein